MQIMFFDTETTGLKPGNICQLSYVLWNNGSTAAINYYFTVDYIEPGAQRVHGLTVSKLQMLSSNKRFEHYHTSIHQDIKDTKLLVGHNVYFDLKFLQAEFKACESKLPYTSCLCTMRHFTDICGLKARNGRRKWPKLPELSRFFGLEEGYILRYTQKLFGDHTIGWHDARYDTVATYLCYMKGLEKGHIKGQEQAVNQ